MGIAFKLLPFLIVFLQAPAEGAKPLRMVALSPLLSEWTAEILGCEETKKRLVGVSEFSDHPSCLKGIPEIGPYHRISVERVLALRPDLVLASEEYNREQAARLTGLGLKVVILPKEGFRSMPSWIRHLGEVLGEAGRANRQAQLWDGFLRGFEKRKQRSRVRRVFVEIQHDPLIGLGGGSFLSEALSAVGLQNVFAKSTEGYPRLSTEAVLRADPEEIHILDLRGHEAEFDAARKDWMRFPGVRAVKNRRIFRLPGEDFARCTPRLLNALKRLN
jgi:ABC-type Fe3+-hydroxamate transport system substrate-binding protein